MGVKPQKYLFVASLLKFIPQKRLKKRVNWQEADNFYICRMSEYLEQDIKFLPGVGPQRAELLKKELKIFTFNDLLY